MSETMTSTEATAPLARAPRIEKDVLSRREAASYITRRFFPIAIQTLANMASNNNKGAGPAFARIGWSHVQYRRADLDEWAAARMVRVE